MAEKRYAKVTGKVRGKPAKDVPGKFTLRIEKGRLVRVYDQPSE